MQLLRLVRLSLYTALACVPTTDKCGRSILITHSLAPAVPMALNFVCTKLASTETAKLFSRKEVIQPHLPIRLPCYDFTPVTEPTVVGCLLAVGAPPSGRPNSHGVTGGVYKARERIHRVMLLRDY